MLLLWLWCSQWAREHAHMRYDDVILNRNWIIAGAPNRLGCLHVLMVNLSYFWPVDGLNTEVRYIQCGSLQSSWTIPLDAPPPKRKPVWGHSPHWNLIFGFFSRKPSLRKLSPFSGHPNGREVTRPFYQFSHTILIMLPIYRTFMINIVWLSA